MPKLPEKLALFTFFVISVFLIIFVITRGIIIYDEGWILHPAQRILQGQIPFKDFQYIYTPLSIYLTAIIFKLLGVSILASRIIVLANYLLSILIILTICKYLKFKIWSTLIAFALFTAWLPLHINFSWPSIYTSLMGLFTILTFLKFEDTKLKRYLILTGIISAITFLFKQNFGIASVLTSVIFLIYTQKNKILTLLYYLSGLISILLIWIGYLIISNSLFAFLADFKYLLIQGMGVQYTPFIYPAPLHIEIFKTVFYLLPLIISIFSLILIRDRKYLTIIPILTLMFYLFGIRPTTDFPHFLPLLAISGLSLGFIFENINNRLVKYSLLILSFILIIAGVYTAFYRDYYKWNQSILSYNQNLNDNRANVLVNPSTKNDLENLKIIVNANSNKNDYIFVTRFSPLLYLTLDRQNPTKYDFVSPIINNQKINLEIIKNIEVKKVKIIIADYDLLYDTNKLSLFILRNYKKINNVKLNSFTVWIKK